MSGPVQPLDSAVEQGPLARIDVKEGRSTSVGGMAISRVLPTKGRRTVGPWCFVDLIHPPDFDDPHPMEIGPHPHIGLATVTWLFEGQALHSDSLGTQQPIRPGQLNLMTAGHGIAHAELGTTGAIHGAQMWLAQPEATRHGGSHFEHVTDLPRVDLSGAEAMVFVGEFEEARSPAALDWETVGIDLRLHGRQTELRSNPEFEYAVVPIDATIKVEEAIAEPGWLALVPTGTERLAIESSGERARVLVLGGRPLGEPIEMWWNFVARTKDEIADAWRAWQSRDEHRFGPVPSGLERMDAPPPPWLPAG